MKDYGSYSYWLETAGDDLTPRPRLEGSIDVDVAILGAGYSGLWTAYYLLKRDPSLKIAILEQEIAGFGASGRNGGWCSSSFPTSYGRIREKYGTDIARLTLRSMYDAVDEVGHVCLDEGIDAHYTKSGALRIARGRHQVAANLDSFRLYDELGFADRYSLLDKQQTDERVRVTDSVGSLLIQDCAALHPGRLARGLARAVERQHATIYEQSKVTDFQTAPRPTLKTELGEARASVVVLAGEAYLTQLSQLNRQLLPMYSTITLTEPIPDHLWEEIGWENRECITSNRYHVDYLQRTIDGRILFGSRGAPYRYGGPIGDHLDRHEPTHASIRDLIIEWFPMLKGIEFTHAWGGPFAVPRDWMPSVAFDERSGLATARGYSGSGVSTANVAGKLLADLITGTDSELRQLPMAGHHSPDWEPEPLRWLAVRYVLWGYERVDNRAKRTGQPPTGRSLAERIGKH